MYVHKKKTQQITNLIPIVSLIVLQYLQFHIQNFSLYKIIELNIKSTVLNIEEKKTISIIISSQPVVFQ